MRKELNELFKRYQNDLKKEVCDIIQMTLDNDNAEEIELKYSIYSINNFVEMM